MQTLTREGIVFDNFYVVVAFRVWFRNLAANWLWEV